MSIVKTTAACGGAARIAGTLVPVWVVASLRALGLGTSGIMAAYPGLGRPDVKDALDYADDHREEILRDVAAQARPGECLCGDRAEGDLFDHDADCEEAKRLEVCAEDEEAALRRGDLDGVGPPTRDEFLDLAGQVQALHAAAAAKVVPLAPGEVQCSAVARVFGDVLCCQRSVHEGEDHIWPDPILSIT